ncbi:cytochrome P450, family 714, subfamily A, polypeptide 1 [Actinidia rufa]|uniref:Cytochrome P450, family 714, subfamily A, polypeptide 1 n=1 Tax=Actinidia rufa TaxID=165716 RepID=A0A7J0FWR2_9ERIC|nr:cytochrome P450, family 714, subfamily A, polypeptide 1 [Actinidia rufa]
MILEAAKSYGDNGGPPQDIASNKFIVDNCKNIYFAALSRHHANYGDSRDIAPLPSSSVCVFVVRETLEDVNFRGIQIPKGINLQILVPLLHQHPDLWGPDVSQFKPESSTGLHAVWGCPSHLCRPTLCHGRIKGDSISLILSRFSFSLSPEYRHSPVFRLVIEPEHGVTLRVRRVCPLFA